MKFIEIVYWIFGITGALMWLFLLIVSILRIFKINVNQTVTKTFVNGKLIKKTVNGKAYHYPDNITHGKAL